jgi:hypothetical protein
MEKDPNISIILSLLVGWGLFSLCVYVYSNVYETEVKPVQPAIDKLLMKVDSVKLYEFDFTKLDTIVIMKGGSLCGTLGMTEVEALAFAKKFNYPVRYNIWNEPNVIVQPGEKFSKNWQPDTLLYLVPKSKK